MRKPILLLIIALAMMQTTQAQDFRFGLNASPTFSFFRSNADLVDNDGLRIGINYGLLLDFLLDKNERYAISTGLTHHLTGGKLAITDTANNVTINQTLKIQYIHIPLTMRLRTNEIGYITYYGQFGFTPGFVVSRRYDQTANPDPNGLFNVDNDKLGNYNVINLALTFGAGLEYSLGGSTAILAGLEYNNGFTNVINDKDNEKISIRNLKLKLGVLF